MEKESKNKKAVRYLAMANQFYLWQKFLSRFGLWKSGLFEKGKEVIGKKSNSEDPKKNIEFSEEALQLFESLERENKLVKEVLIRKYKELSVTPEAEEVAYNYVLAHSVILTAMTTFPRTSVFTEFLYTGIPSSFAFDRYVLQCRAGKAVKARLIAIERELPKIIKEYHLKNNNVLIGNLGSGPGRDVINVLSTHYRNISDIKAIHIDKDVNALRKGKIMAKTKKVDHLIEFIQENFLKYNLPQRFDILLLIGILCPLDMETCVSILRTIKKFLKKDGCIIVSNVTKKMEREDPFSYFIMKWMADWKLIFKDEEELEQIFKKAGYVWKGGFRDSYGFHLMGIGTPIFY